MLLADQLLFGLSGPWRTISDFLPRGHPLERGIVSDRLALRELRDVGAEARSVVILGNSRARAVFRRAQARRVDPRTVHIELSHAGMDLYESLATAYRLEPFDVDVTVLVLSEIELHSPVYLKPWAGVGSWRALGDLLHHLEPSTLLERRRDLLGLAASASLAAYRDRRVIHAAAVDSWRRFPLDRLDRLDRPSPPAVADALKPLAPMPNLRLSDAERAELAARLAPLLPHLPPAGLRAQIYQLAGVAPGPHTRLNEAVLLDLVEALRGIGSEVLLVEAPIHPVAEEVYDRALREPFLDLAEGLATREGVHFMPLEETGPFGPNDFADLTHLARHRDQAAPRMARRIAERARTLLDREVDSEADETPL